MKHYDAKFIHDFIEKNKDEIVEVECGMKEDWHWTAETIYEDGEYNLDFDGKEKICIAGITGSSWATPYMIVTYKDEGRKGIECWSDDYEKESISDTREKMAFAKMTGGMDSAPV